VKFKTSDNQSGFALVAAIWLAGMVAAIATGFIVKVRLNTLESATLQRLTEAQYMADGLTRLTAWRLARGGATAKTNGTAHACWYRDAVPAVVAVQDQSGLIDLNTMPQSFFADFFVRLGANALHAKELAGALADFRDPDREAAGSGSEPPQYPDRAFGPKDAPFQAIQELDQLPGMTDALYRAALPLVTVYGSQPGIAPEAAPEELRKLYGERPTGDFASALAPYSAPATGKIFEIDVSVKLGRSRFRRQAIAVILQQPDKPFAFVEWRQGEASEAPIRPPAAPCFDL
jgi:general secretion pathway protein K